jgi:site-specific recombinase XerD
MRARADLPGDTVPKVIRHTMATHLRASGVPEAEIQGFLGHKAYSGKTEVYARYRPDYLGQAVTAIDGYMAALRVSCVLESKKATG